MNERANRRSRRLGVTVFSAVLGLASVLPGQTFAYNRWVELINDTDHVLVEFFASNRDAPDWGRDRLGTRVLWPGDSLPRNIDDGSGYCLFDFKAVFDDGDALVRYGVDVCSIVEYRYF